MSKVIRVFVEKKMGFDIEAQHLLSDLRDNLGMKQITGLRLACRYDVSGLTGEEFARARGIVFSEPNVDRVYDEQWDSGEERLVFATEYLPGQYDQRADSAAQCAQLLTQGERPEVRTARVIALSGDISGDDFARIQRYLVNPVESRVASLEKPESLAMAADIPADIERIHGFISWDETALKTYYDGMGFAMTLSDLAFCRDYFRDDERRDPSVTELRVIDTYWSDHCRHTTFLTELTAIDIERGQLSQTIEAALALYYEAREEVYGQTDRAVSLMDMAVMGMKLLRKRGQLPDLDVSEEINACSIEVPVEIDGRTEQWLVQFKNETHNHPTEIEPFGGAATCLGGAIRDPLSGRSYVYQAMRVTGSGDPRLSLKDTLPGKLPTRKITTGAAHGYSSYGNQIGLATGQVVELYDPGYVAKRMEIGAVIGASPKDNVTRGVPSPGDVIVLLGGRTGRDGCGGATGSSKAHTEQSIETCGAEVQKGNPPTERKIQRLFRNADVAKRLKRCNDFGAGGVCVAIGELANGLTIDLDNVPKKYDGLDGTELAISESQERMAVVLDPADVDSFMAAADVENLEAVVVAEVTAAPVLSMRWRGDEIVSLKRKFLDTNGVTQQARAYIPCPDPTESYRTKVPDVLENSSIPEAFEENLRRLEVCSQKGLSERFDSSIGASTVLMPFAGTHQLTPEEAMVATLPLVTGETDTATAMSYGYMPGASRWSPFHGSAYAVVESLSKILAVGANPLTARLTFQEYFERLHDKPERWGKPAAALLGALTAQIRLGVPSIGGKDSMSGSFEHLDVPPTLCSFAVAMTKASNTRTAAFQNVNSTVLFVDIPEEPGDELPDWDRLKALYAALYAMTERGEILSMSVVREGGVAAAVARMCFGNKIGFSFREDMDKETLFAPLSGGMVLELRDGATCTKGFPIGTTNGNEYITVAGKGLPLDDLIEAWSSPLEPIFPEQAKEPEPVQSIPLYTERNTRAPAIQTAKPRVFIPVFPGTNCEVDSARAFERAGAQADVLVVRNLSPEAIEETIQRITQGIEQSQIVMLPGGFSGGDEPDGSGKFIATTFRNPRVSEAVTRLLTERDGLMLGICNGFQALIKLGLVPNGKITDIGENDPTLTFNFLGRHVSRMVYTRVTSVHSPWLTLAQAGDLHCVPVSHGEGRFVADQKTLDMLQSNGQIAFQYCDPQGNPSSDIRWNPNGSVCAIEGIVSPDGRVLGKMGHSERSGMNRYKNVPGDKDQKIFESGVAYFK